MRKLPAILMLVVFASLTAIDRICCPDGCTHEQAPSSTSSAAPTDGVCVLCAGGLGSASPEDLSPGVPVMSPMARVAVTGPDDVPPDPPDHPPRS